MATAIWPSMPFTRSSTSRTGTAATLGKAATTADCTAASRARGTRAVASSVCGAPSRAPGDRITKKLAPSVCHSTRRRLATRAVTGTPSTSKVSEPPTPTPSCFAMSSSTEARGSRAASSGVHHRPATSVSRPGASAAHVSMYSRVSGQASSRRARVSAWTGTPPTADSRARTTGSRSTPSTPTSAWSSWRNGEAWSGWMSMKKNAGATPALATAIWRARLRSSRATETISMTARPSETSTAAAWLPGRYRLASPWRTTSDRARPRRARRTTPRAQSVSSTSAPPRPPTNSAPTLIDPACQRHSAARPAAMAASTGQPGRPPTPPSTCARSRIAGRTRRTSSSGQSAQRSVTPTPMARPPSTARGAGTSATGSASSRASSGPASGRAALPSAAPSRLPPRPSRRVWIR